MVSIVRTAGNCEVWVLASLTRSYTIEGHNFALSIQMKIFALRTMKRMYVLSTALLSPQSNPKSTRPEAEAQVFQRLALEHKPNL